MRVTTPVLTAIIIILFLSSFFIPFIAVLIIHDTMYHSLDYIFFQTPFSAYMTFMAGMFSVVTILTVYVIIRTKRERELKQTRSSPILFCLFLSIPLFIMPALNYFYISEHGIHYNYLFQFSEVTYHWHDVDEYDRVLIKEHSRTRPKEHVFTMKDGSTMTIPHSQNFSQNSARIVSILRQNGVSINDFSLIEK